MPEILKGNFAVKTPVASAGPAAPSLEERFEREAMKRLGGSIAFVAKKKVIWEIKDEGD